MEKESHDPTSKNWTGEQFSNELPQHYQRRYEIILQFLFSKIQFWPIVSQIYWASEFGGWNKYNLLELILNAIKDKQKKEEAELRISQVDSEFKDRDSPGKDYFQRLFNHDIGFATSNGEKKELINEKIKVSFYFRKALKILIADDENTFIDRPEVPTNYMALDRIEAYYLFLDKKVKRLTENNPSKIGHHITSDTEFGLQKEILLSGQDKSLTHYKILKTEETPIPKVSTKSKAVSKSKSTKTARKSEYSLRQICIAIFCMKLEKESLEAKNIIKKYYGIENPTSLKNFNIVNKSQFIELDNIFEKDKWKKEDLKKVLKLVTSENHSIGIERATQYWEAFWNDYTNCYKIDHDLFRE